MATLVQQPHPVIMSQVIRLMSELAISFDNDMTNFRPNSSMVFHQGSMPRDLSGSQQEMSFMQQINNPNFP